MKLRGESEANEVTELRGSIAENAIKHASCRFIAEKSVDSPSVWVVDKVTGRQTRVSLYAAKETLQALNELFPAGS